ncbi:hypothetical protein [Vibrio sinaloensis]|uniref:hypothetical protein n=1 Tax=Photobacterium sp. (strain ATCC 43367) TaxID=379097 RepID=UPI0035E47F40
MTDQQLEFEHIYLEVRAQRWQQIERFLFSYYCYREGFVSANNKPDWESARQNAPRSTAVRNQQEACLEPVVPLKAVVGEIKRYWRDGKLTPASLQRILDSLVHYVSLSQAELASLKKAGLHNAMPASWYQSEEKLPMARLNAINSTLNQPFDQNS